jgi:hypothetical protein
MTAHVPRLSFSLDLLLPEAKRRMRNRRVQIAVLAVLIAGSAAGAEQVLASSSAVQPAGACPVTGGYYAYVVPGRPGASTGGRCRRYQLGVDAAQAPDQGR